MSEQMLQDKNNYFIDLYRQEIIYNTMTKQFNMMT